VAAKLIEDDDFARCKRGRQHLLDVQREELAIDGAINNPGALIRSWRSAAMKVMVFQWPKGADATRR